MLCHLENPKRIKSCKHVCKEIWSCQNDVIVLCACTRSSLPRVESRWISCVPPLYTTATPGQQDNSVLQCPKMAQGSSSSNVTVHSSAFLKRNNATGYFKGAISSRTLLKKEAVGSVTHNHQFQCVPFCHKRIPNEMM